MAKKTKTPKRTVDVLLKALRARKAGLTVSDLTERCLPGAAVTQTRQALYRLEDQGLVRKERTGAIVLWFATEKRDQAAA